VNGTHALAVEEIQTTRGEKALAFVLGIFVLIGLVWGYDQLDTRRSAWDYQPAFTAEEQAAIDAETAAQNELARAHDALGVAFDQLELKRERYRTALDAGRPARALEADYRRAERTLARAQGRVAFAEQRLAETRPAAAAARERANQEQIARERREARITFFGRLAYCLAVLGLAYGLLLRLRGSRYFAVGTAAVAAAAILSLLFAGDYISDYVEWRDKGPVVIAAAGVGLSLGAFWVLQRYLQRRIPLRRVRKGECPFCGFPARGNTSCEGCGRTVAGACSHCDEPRRVGVLFCGSCGKA
jgi:hypothetical protein